MIYSGENKIHKIVRLGSAAIIAFDAAMAIRDQNINIRISGLWDKNKCLFTDRLNIQVEGRKGVSGLSVS
jgi:hypothetical protein